MNRYTAPTAPAAVQVETRAPLRESRIESEVQVPLLVSLISAGIVVLVVALLAILRGWPWETVPTAGAAALTVMWFWRGVARSEAMLWTRERITQHDINGDGTVGRPHGVTLLNPPAPQPAAEPEPYTTTKQALIAFTTTCYLTGETSERAHGIRPWQRGRYTDFRDALLRLGLAEWRDPARPRGGWQVVGDLDDALAIIGEHVV